MYLNRDLSWLSFNGRVLEEAMRNTVPLMERFKFLSIYSSNLDEFFRVRMPVLMLSNKAKHAAAEDKNVFETAKETILQQQQNFGKTLREVLIPALSNDNIELLYNRPIPAELDAALKEYFLSSVLGFIEIVHLSAKQKEFFARSNSLYKIVQVTDEAKGDKLYVINIPSDKLPRFFSAMLADKQYILFLDDIIKQYLPLVFPSHTVVDSWNIKITRDAELDIADEYEGDLSEKIEKQLAKRNDGKPTRFLYDANLPMKFLPFLFSFFSLSHENAIEGGAYHNLKDLDALPIARSGYHYEKKAFLPAAIDHNSSIDENISRKDLLVHTPYQTYNAVLRFFNEAAVDENVTEICTTLYRIAGDSKIVNALITAAKNGKQVTVFIELKARFDEENNIHWSKKMKAAGVQIITSIPGLKVHAKVALVKRTIDKKNHYSGLIATGNLNEITARFYTDHILMTRHEGIVKELKWLFSFLCKRKKPESADAIAFKHLLVAQFNLQPQFLAMIDEEISNKKKGLPAGITIKLNNLEEKVLINKLCEASQAGVKVRMIVRSICCLAPGIPGLSENISITRIVDRYLEHGRVFIFTNGGNERIFIGSSDWMNRNVYRRIEVCCPVYDETLRRQLKDMIELQLRDNVQAVALTPALDNTPMARLGEEVRSQEEIYEYLKATE